jgi:hypothetical protein
VNQLSSNTGESIQQDRFTPEYRSGVAAAIDQLSTWERSETPPQAIAREWRAGVSDRTGDLQRGFADAIAAYLWVCMEEGTPIIGRWDVLRELADMEVSHG